MLDLTSFEGALKTIYSPDQVKRLTYGKDPINLLLPKNTKFVGENKKISVIYGNGGGRSATFSNALSRGQASNSKVGKFMLTRVSDYGVCKIDAETIEATATDAGALITSTKTEFDSVLDNLLISQTGGIYRDSSGAIGQINANLVSGTNTLVLKDPDDVVSFQIDQELVFWDAKSGGSQHVVRTGVSTAIITTIDRDTGTIGFAAGTVAAGVDVVADDYIFVNGDRGKKISGLSDWLPRTAPTSGDSFFGTDRSDDPVRMAGVRKDIRGMPIEEGLNATAARLHREGAAPTHCLLPLTKYTELQNALGSKVQYVNVTSRDVANISFTGIKLLTPKAVLSVLPSAYLEGDTGFMLTMATWKLETLNENIRLLNLDGNRMLRSTSDDAYEARFGTYGNLSCCAPGWNANMQLS